jgi:phosphoglycerol transferase
MSRAPAQESIMTATARAHHPRFVQLALLAALAAMFAYLLHRNLGLNPAIMADELYYSMMSRRMALSQAAVPSYLYLWLFGASKACGDGFLDCVRIGNALFFVGAAPLVYATARRFLRPGLALAAALVSLLLPLNLYTTLFMPESMYYFGFCLLSWTALTRASWPWAPYALALGAILGLMSLVKVHALFLLPALCVFLAALRRRARPGGAWVREALLSAAIVALVTFALKFGLGYLFAGPDGVTLFGSLYGGMAHGSQRTLAELFTPALVNGAGHAMALAVLLALPLAVAVHLLASRAAREHAGSQLPVLALYALLMLLAAGGMTVAFTASIAANAPPLEMLRLHLRYYSFVFPLLCIVGFAATERGAGKERAAGRAAVALPLAGLLLAAPFALPHYVLWLPDGPDIASLAQHRAIGNGVIFIELLALLLWAAGSRWGARLFAAAALPLLLAAGLGANTVYLAQLLPSGGPADRAGRFAHEVIPPAERKITAVAGAGPQETMRAQFYIDDKDVTLVDVPKDVRIQPFHLPPRVKWLLVVGNRPLPEGLHPVVSTADYSLVKLVPNGPALARAAFSQPYGIGAVGSAEGLAGPESWGRWSDGARVVLHLAKPLPRQAIVILTAHAFGPNVGLPFTLRAGSQAAQFTLGAAPREVGLRFDTDGSVRTLTLEVPRPTAPFDLGLSPDRRKLGIALAGIEVAAAAAPVLSAN